MDIVRYHTDKHPQTVLVMGNFDGVHRGHQALIGAARTLASAQNLPLGVMTFEPHPRSMFAPFAEPFRLTDARQKSALFAESGVDILFLRHFNTAFATLTALEFIDKVIVGDCRARHVVIGHDFCFGKDRAGNKALLEEIGMQRGFTVHQVAPLQDRWGQTYSSTAVRQALMNEAPQEAARLLGRPWSLDGRVQAGEQRGRTIGFPTANLPLAGFLCPAFGVYAVTVKIEGDDETYHGVANIGVRPTVGDTETPLLEVHLFHVNKDLYGQRLTVSLHDFIRSERRFPTFAALRAQITEDCAAAQDCLMRLEAPAPLQRQVV